MENSNNTGKILVFFTAIVFLFFVYEVMTNTSKVSQVNVPQPSVPNINIINKPTFDPKISVSDNSVTKQENTSVTERNNNNNNNNNRNTIRRTRSTRRPPVNIIYNRISPNISTPREENTQPLNHNCTPGDNDTTCTANR